MSFMVYIDEYAAWSASSLRGAQELAKGYIESGCPLKIIDYESRAIDRTWVYDYDRALWIEPRIQAADFDGD
jgi:hypothetical protein